MSTTGDQHCGYENATGALKPPSDRMLLSREMKELGALTANPHVSREKLQYTLEELAASPAQHTRGGTFSQYINVVGNFPSLSELINGFYVPVGSPLSYVQADHRYAIDQSWPSPNGAAAASKITGQLFALTRARLAGKDDRSNAGVYIIVPTPTPRYGQVNRLRFEPDISWSLNGQVAMDWDWARFAAGKVVVQGKLWLVAYELNVATNAFEPLQNNSAVNTPAGVPWSLNGPGFIPFAQSGHFPAGSFALECIVDPARTYLFGVVAQTQIWHNLTHADGPSHQLPEPGPGQFNTFGILNATVPEMWISHTVLA